MSQPVFPKGTKVVKGKVVQRKQGSSQVKRKKNNDRVERLDSLIRSLGGEAGLSARFGSEWESNPNYLKALMRKIQEGRTGPRLAPGQQSEPKTSTKRVFEEETGMGEYIKQRNPLGDPRQQRELPKIRPGRPRPVLPEFNEAFFDANGSPIMSPDASPPTYYGGAKASDIRDRRKNPSMEGRGDGFLSKIQEAMEGKKMPAPLLKQLKGLDPVKLEKILALIKKSKVGRERQQLNAETKRSKAMERAATKDYDENYGRNQNEM